MCLNKPVNGIVHGRQPGCAPSILDSSETGYVAVSLFLDYIASEFAHRILLPGRTVLRLI